MNQDSEEFMVFSNTLLYGNASIQTLDFLSVTMLRNVDFG